MKAILLFPSYFVILPFWLLICVWAAICGEAHIDTRLSIWATSATWLAKLLSSLCWLALIFSAVDFARVWRS